MSNFDTPHNGHPHPEEPKIWTPRGPRKNPTEEWQVWPGVTDLPPLYLYNDSEVLALPQEPELVPGLIPVSKGIGSFYGPPGSGKSFLLQDFLSHAANVTQDSPRTWFGYQMAHKELPVVIVPFEGRGGMPKRIRAWQLGNTVNSVIANTKCRYMLQPLNLAKEREFDHFCRHLDAYGFEGGYLGLDTLASAFPGIKENDSEGMGGVVIARAQMLADRFGCVVIIVHHTGKDLKAGMRGWSGLEGALDFTVECLKVGDGATRTFEIKKQKDDETGAKHKFKLRRITVGYNQQTGKDITSCVVALVDPKTEGDNTSANNSAAAIKATELNKADDKAVWHYVADKVAKGERVSKEIVSANRNTIRPNMTVAQVRDAMNRLIGDGKMASEGTTNNKTLRALEKTPDGGYDSWT